MDDLDAHHLLLRRAFLSLVAMERWNAAGISAQTIIPEDLTYLVAADKVLLGDLGYSALSKYIFSISTLVRGLESRGYVFRSQRHLSLLEIWRNVAIVMDSRLSHRESIANLS